MHERIVRVEVDEAPVLVLLHRPAPFPQPLGRRSFLLQVVENLAVLLGVETQGALQISD